MSKTKKAAAKKAPAKAAKPAANKPIKEALSKSGLVAHLAEASGVLARDVRNVLSALEGAVAASLSKKGVGHFTLPGLLKISLRKVPARKAGTLIRNPSTGEMVPGAAKPASVRVKIRPLSKLKAATV